MRLMLSKQHDYLNYQSRGFRTLRESYDKIGNESERCVFVIVNAVVEDGLVILLYQNKKCRLISIGWTPIIQLVNIVAHCRIYVSVNWYVIGLPNGFSSVGCRITNLTCDDLLSIGLPETYFSDISIKTYKRSYFQIHLLVKLAKPSSAKWWPLFGFTYV